MIKIRNLFKTYDDKTKALNNINLDLNDKELYFLVGKSGSGKTTFLNILSGIDTPSSGYVMFEDKNIASLSEKEKASFRAQNVSFIFQNFNLIERWTVEENIIFPLKLFNNQIDRNEVDSLIRKLGLIDEKGDLLNNKLVANLSGGQKQRVAIARALVKKPKILLADEPTGSLDSENAKQIIDILREISRETCVLIVTHDKSLINKNDNVLTISDGYIDCSCEGTESVCEPKKQIKTRTKSSFSSIILFGINFLFSKKIRTFFSIALCFLSLFMFTLPLVGVSQDLLDVKIDTLLSKNVKLSYIENNSKRVDPYYDFAISEFSDTQKEKIEKYNNFKNIYVYSGTYLYDGINRQTSSIYPYENFLLDSFKYTIEIPQEFDLSILGLEVDHRLSNPSNSRMPKNFNEMAITSLQASYLLKYGFYNETEQLNFPSVNEIIGSTLNDYYICGIFESSDFNVVTESYLNKKDDRLLDYSKSVVLSKMTFTLEGFEENQYEVQHEVNSYLTAPTPKSMAVVVNSSKKKMKELVSSLRYKDTVGENNIQYDSSLLTPYDFSIERTNILRTREFIVALLIVASLTGLLSIACISFVIYSNYENKKKELGILTTLGASKNLISRIYLTECIILTLISFLLNCILITAISVITTLKFGIVLFKPTIGIFGIGLLFISLIVILSTIFIKFALNKKDPIDLVKEL